MSKEQFDNKMDHLFRNAADNFQAPFKEEAWDKMEQLLDKDEKKRRFIIWWWITPAILLSIGAFLFFNKHQTAKEEVVISQNTSKAQQEKSNIQLDKNHESIDEKKDQQTNYKNVDSTISSKKNNGNNLLTNDNERRNNTVTKESIIKVEKTISTQENGINVSKKNNQKSHLHLSNEHVKKTYRTIQKDKRIVNVDVANSIKKSTDKSIVYKGGKSSIIENVAKQNNTGLYGNISTYNTIDSVKNKTEIATTNDEIKIDSVVKKVADTLVSNGKDKKKSIQQNSKKSRLELSALIAADLTTVKFKHADKISTAAGIGIAYSISKRLSIATGFAVAKKIYKADTIDYKGFYYNPRYTDISAINAKCLVFEIPLNLQYQFKQNKKSSWIGLVGLSSYLMNTEEYDYNYLYSGNPNPVNLKYKYKGENKHYLSILNLGIAYRRQINKNFSWQLTPYCKLPLTGIGHGKVSLSSTGLQLSIHYNSIKNK